VDKLTGADVPPEASPAPIVSVAGEEVLLFAPNKLGVFAEVVVMLLAAGTVVVAAKLIAPGVEVEVILELVYVPSY